MCCIRTAISTGGNIQIRSACCVCLSIDTPYIRGTCCKRCDGIGSVVYGKIQCCCIRAAISTGGNIQIRSACCVCLSIDTPYIRGTCCNRCDGIGSVVYGKIQCCCIRTAISTGGNIQIRSAGCVCLIVGTPYIRVTCCNRCDGIGSVVYGKIQCCCIRTAIGTGGNIQIRSAGCVCLIVGTPYIRVTCGDWCDGIGSVVYGKIQCCCIRATIGSCCNIIMVTTYDISLSIPVPCKAVTCNGCCISVCTIIYCKV